MIACIIEFGIQDGAEAERDRLVAELMEEVKTIDGFISKETLVSRDVPGKLITLSYWRDEQSLRALIRNPIHARSVVVGKKSVFSHYRIQISEVRREIDWSIEGGRRASTVTQS